MIWIRKRKSGYTIYYNRDQLVFSDNASVLINALTGVLTDLMYKIECKVLFNLLIN